MKIPPFWYRSECRINDKTYRLRGVSWVSEAEALAHWQTKAQLMQEFLATGCNAAALERMRRRWRVLDAVEEGEYAVLMPEPVVQQLNAANIITRNRYGAAVLNSTELCFIDVDHIPPPPLAWLLRLLGKNTEPEARLLQSLRSLVSGGVLQGARVYRTSRGWRILALDSSLSPASARMQSIFETLHADALYAHLCARQQCWRARLTPKPSKVGMPRYPRPMCSAEASSPAVLEWIERYRAASEQAAVCRLVETVGSVPAHPIIALHDEWTRALRPDWPLR